MTGADVALLGLAVLLALVASGLACLEAALSRVSRVRVEELAREGRSGAGRLQQVSADPARYLNLLLLLRLAAELTAVTLVALVLVRRVGADLRTALAVPALMTPVSYVFIGVVPRTVGRQHADSVALWAAGIAVPLTRLLGPLARLLIVLGNAVTPGRGFRDGPFASEAELRDLVDLAEERQVIEGDERRMIHSVFELGDTIVREVMVPRPDIVFLPRDRTVGEALALHLQSGFSRIPVLGDNEDDVLGLSYLKDLVPPAWREGRDALPVERLMRPVYLVPDSKPVDELLKEMQARQVHMAVVIDEYGGTAGLATIEDILEEIVGEIADEYDREEPPVERLGEGTLRVTARLPVEELNERYDVELPTDDVETVAGLLASELGHVPIAGDAVTLQGLRLTAENPDGRRNRISKVLIERVGPAGGTDDRPAASQVTADA